jgi:hypothetical protein
MAHKSGLCFSGFIFPIALAVLPAAATFYRMPLTMFIWWAACKYAVAKAVRLASRPAGTAGASAAGVTAKAVGSDAWLAFPGNCIFQPTIRLDLFPDSSPVSPVCKDLFQDRRMVMAALDKWNREKRNG